MKSNHHLLKESIESLKLIQMEIHDVMDSSKQAEFAKIISDLEKHGAEKTQTELLELFGKCLNAVPAIERLIKILSEF